MTMSHYHPLVLISQLPKVLEQKTFWSADSNLGSIPVHPCKKVMLSYIDMIPNLDNACKREKTSNASTIWLIVLFQSAIPYSNKVATINSSHFLTLRWPFKFHHWWCMTCYSTLSLYIYRPKWPNTTNFWNFFCKKTLFRNYIGKYHFFWYSSFLNSSS